MVKKPKLMFEETKEEMKEAETPAARGKKEDGEPDTNAGVYKRGGKVKRAARKHGGRVPGSMGGLRPDRRSRGGTADTNPMTAAGNMSIPDYQKTSAGVSTGGRGKDLPKD